MGETSDSGSGSGGDAGGGGGGDAGDDGGGDGGGSPGGDNAPPPDFALWMRAFMESTTSFATVIDRAGTILYANYSPPGLGSPEQLRGTRLCDLAPPDEHDQVIASCGEVFATGKQIARQSAAPAPDGTTRHFSSEVVPVRRGGEVVAAVVMTRDVTAMKEMELSLARSEERLRSVVESAPALIMTVDREGMITSQNQTHGSDPVEAFIGRSAYEFVPPDAVGMVKETFRRVLETGERAAYEISGAGAPDARSDYHVHVGPLRRGDAIVGLTLITFDIAGQKRLEAELRLALERAGEQNAALEREVAQRRRAEDELRDKQRAMLELSTPIIHAWEGVIALPVIGAVDRARADQMMQRLLDEIVQTGASAAILDLTGMDRVDADTAAHLVSIVRAARLLGSRVLLTGIPPEAAGAMAELDLGGEPFETYARLRDALAAVIARSGPAPSRRGG